MLPCFAFMELNGSEWWGLWVPGGRDGVEGMGMECSGNSGPTLPRGGLPLE